MDGVKFCEVFFFKAPVIFEVGGGGEGGDGESLPMEKLLSSQ